MPLNACATLVEDESDDDWAPTDDWPPTESANDDDGAMAELLRMRAAKCCDDALPKLSPFVCRRADDSLRDNSTKSSSVPLSKQVMLDKAAMRAAERAPRLSAGDTPVGRVDEMDEPLLATTKPTPTLLSCASVALRERGAIRPVVLTVLLGASIASGLNKRLTSPVTLLWRPPERWRGADDAAKLLPAEGLLTPCML